MQNKLSEIYLYIELDEKNARKLERKIFEKLSELNFYCSLRVEGYAFFLNRISETIGLPNIRLIISKNILITRIHMIPGLIEEKALAIGLTSQEVYSKIEIHIHLTAASDYLEQRPPLATLSIQSLEAPHSARQQSYVRLDQTCNLQLLEFPLRPFLKKVLHSPNIASYGEANEPA